MSHYTVHIEIHRVSEREAKPPTYRGGDDGRPASVDKTAVLNMTTRVEGVTSADLEKAINKAITHLNSERPDTEGK